MSKYMNGAVIVFENDVHEEDVERILAAIRQFRGVLSAEANVRDVNGFIERERLRREIAGKLWDVLSARSEEKKR